MTHSLLQQNQSPSNQIKLIHYLIQSPSQITLRWTFKLFLTINSLLTTKLQSSIPTRNFPFLNLPSLFFLFPFLFFLSQITFSYHHQRISSSSHKILTITRKTNSISRPFMSIQSIQNMSLPQIPNLQSSISRSRDQKIPNWVETQTTNSPSMSRIMLNHPLRPQISYSYSITRVSRSHTTSIRCKIYTLRHRTVSKPLNTVFSSNIPKSN